MSTNKKRMLALLLLVFQIATACSQANNGSGLKLQEKISIPGNEKWDYLTLDTVHNRLFISHGTQVQVMDIQTKKLVASIPNTPGVHGIAFAYELNKGFTSNGKDSTVTVFDLNTLKEIKRIKVTGANPDAILYDPFTQRIFTFNGKSRNATVIQAKDEKVIGTIDLDGKPEFAVSDKKGKIYVNLEDKSEALCIDPSNMKIVSRWSLSPGEEPSGMAIDIANSRLFIGCANQMMIILNANTGKVIQSLPIGDHVDANAYDPVKHWALSSNGDGTLTVVKQINPDKYVVIDNVATQKGARTMALDDRSHTVYLSTASFGMPAKQENGRLGRPSIEKDSFVLLIVR